jgi:hypothetical protein
MRWPVCGLNKSYFISVSIRIKAGPDMNISDPRTLYAFVHNFFICIS